MAIKTNCYPVHFSGDDMGPAPSRWNDRGIDASQQVFFWWGYLTEPDCNPILLVRNMGGEARNWMSSLTHIECSKGMFEKPTTLDCNPIAEGDIINRLHLCEDAPEGYGEPGDKVYEMTIDSGDRQKLFYRAGTRRFDMKESDFLDVTGENAEYALCIDPPGVFGPYFTWSSVCHGKYCGKDVTFMGGGDRFYSLEQMMNLSDPSAYYFGNIVSGIDENGRKEYGAFYMFNEKMFAYYVRDGEEPKYTEQVEYEAEWESDPSDPDRIAPRTLVWKFDDVEIHWQAEYTSMYVESKVNHFGHWYEKNGSKNFVHYLGALESNIHASQIKNL